MDQVPLLLFSGGMDSTFMLQQALAEGDVETIYVSAAQCPNKIKKELEHREKLFAKLRRIYPNTEVRRDRVIELGRVMDGSMPDHKFIQPALWIHAALTAIDADRHSELRIGYVNGDAILRYVDDVRASWDALQKFTKWRPLPVKFPLELTKKQTILRRLHPQLYQDIWVCELPKAHGKHFRACGKCEPCLTHAAMLFVYERVEGRSFVDYNASLLPSYRLPPQPRQKKVELIELSPDLLIDAQPPKPRKKNGNSKGNPPVVSGAKLHSRRTGRHLSGSV